MDPNLFKIFKYGNKKTKNYVILIKKLLNIIHLIKRKNILYGLILYYLQLCKEESNLIIHIEKFKRFIPIHTRLITPSLYLANNIRYISTKKLIAIINHII